MTLFLILAALMVLAAIVFLYLGTAPINDQETDQNRSNLQIFRHRLNELETEKSQGMIDQQTVDALKIESAKTLFSDWGEQSSAVATKASKTPYISLLALLIPLSAVLIYNQLGRYELVDYVEQTAPQAAASTSDEDDLALIDQLAERLEANPDRLEGWLLLGRSYRSIGRAEEALAAYQRGRSYLPGSLPLLIAEVEMHFYMSRGRADQTVSQLIEQGLQAQPDNARLLLYQGLALFQRGEGERAVAQWQALIKDVDPESAMYAQLKTVIEQGQAQLAQTAAEPDLTPPSVAAVALEISVGLSSAALDNVAADDTVYIYAKAASGPPMPVAIKKVRVADLPLRLTLSDADSLMPTKKLSSQSDVLVGAHVSRSGQAGRQAGDWVATAVLTRVADAKPIQLVIDQEHR